LTATVVLAAACVLVTACAPDSGVQLPEFTTPAQLSELVASLEDGEAASLDLVSMMKSSGGSIDVGTHEDELFSSGYERADIGAVEWVNGIRTELTVPMWYGPDTTIRIEEHEPEPMLEAVETTVTLGGPYYWSGEPVVSIEFHMEQGALVLDSAVVPATR
jgi:hypothetical protein